MDKKIQDELIGALIGLARATEGTSPTKEIYQTIIRGLTKYNAVDISDDEVRDLIQDVRSMKELLVPECSKCQAPCGRNDEYDMKNMWNAKEDIRGLKISVLEKIHRIAMCMCSVGEEGANEKINNTLCEALFMIGYAENSEMILPIINKIDEISEDGYGI